jgi:hypothetical protein
MLCLDYDVIACHDIFFETTERNALQRWKNHTFGTGKDKG